MNLQQYNQAKKELKQNPDLIYDKDFNYNINELKNNLMKKFSVWVGGTEVNDQLLTREEAENLAFEYEDDGLTHPQNWERFKKFLMNSYENRNYI